MKTKKLYEYIYRWYMKLPSSTQKRGVVDRSTRIFGQNQGIYFIWVLIRIR